MVTTVVRCFLCTFIIAICSYSLPFTDYQQNIDHRSYTQHQHIEPGNRMIFCIDLTLIQNQWMRSFSPFNPTKVKQKCTHIAVFGNEFEGIFTAYTTSNETTNHLFNKKDGLFFIILIFVIFRWYSQSSHAMHKLMLCAFYSLCITITYGAIEYNGPASIDFFHDQYNQSLEIEGPLQCLDGCLICHTAEIFTQKTTETKPIRYYELILTDAMKEMFKATLEVTTCCTDKLTFDALTDNIIDWEFSSGRPEPSEYANTNRYSRYCDSDTLDTFLYLLYEKKGKINLLQTVDDVDSSICGHKSSIDLHNYPAGTYIVAVGGYDIEYGRFAVGLNCEDYSEPITEATADQFDPYLSDDSDDITCNDTVLDWTVGKSSSMEYYKIDITSTTYLPIRVSLCFLRDGSQFGDIIVYLIKHEQYGSSYDIFFSIVATSIGLNATYYNGLYCGTDIDTHKKGDDTHMKGIEAVSFVVDDTENTYERGTYYLAIQTKYPPSSINTNALRIKMDCAPAPTMPPTSVPTTYPSVIPTYSPTTEPTIYPSNIPTFVPSDKPTQDPTATPTGFPTKEPTIIPTHDPTVDPTLEPTIYPTIIPTIAPTQEPTEDPTSHPTQNPTLEPTASPTKEYSFPIKKGEFTQSNSFNNAMISNVYTEIICGGIYTEQENTEDELVSYYKFTKTNKMYKPSYITTNTDYNIYDTVLYIIKLNDVEMLSYSEEAYIDITSLDNGVYLVAVQGYDNEVGTFSIEMECAPRMPKELVMALVFGTCGVAVLILFIYYIYEWRLYCKRTPLWFNQSRHIAIAQTDEDEAEYKSNTEAICCCCCGRVKFDDNYDGLNREEEKIEAGDARSIDADSDLISQLADNEDMVQMVLAHVIQCFDDAESLDIYQVLSLRYFDKESRRISAKKPFTKIGINISFIVISSFVRSAFIAIVVALAQTIGITVVVYKLLVAYFEELEDDLEICVMDESRWNQVYSLKMLSFLLSLIITFYVSMMLNNMQHSGLYEALDRLKAQHLMRIDRVVLWILQIGQIINYYVCLLAVLGSYFIIFESNKGDELDDGTVSYSHSGLDMILNAVALFFMLELDDVMVNSQDYNDCKQHLEQIMQCYHSDLSINAHYQRLNVINDNIEKLDVSDYINWSHKECTKWIISLDKSFDDKYGDNIKETFNEKKMNALDLVNAEKVDIASWGIHQFNDNNKVYQEIRIQFKNNNDKCLKYVVPSTQFAINIFSVLVKVCCYIGGFFAPFFIFFCW